MHVLALGTLVNVENVVKKNVVNVQLLSSCCFILVVLSTFIQKKLVFVVVVVFASNLNSSWAQSMSIRSLPMKSRNRVGLSRC